MILVRFAEFGRFPRVYSKTLADSLGKAGTEVREQSARSLYGLRNLRLRINGRTMMTLQNSIWMILSKVS